MKQFKSFIVQISIYILGIVSLSCVGEGEPTGIQSQTPLSPTSVGSTSSPVSVLSPTPSGPTPQTIRCGEIIFWGRTLENVAETVIVAPTDSERRIRLRKYSNQIWHSSQPGFAGHFIDSDKRSLQKGVFALKDEYWLAFSISEENRKEIDWLIYQTHLRMYEMFFLSDSSWNSSLEDFVPYYRRALQTFVAMADSVLTVGLGCQNSQEFVNLKNRFKVIINGPR